MAKTRFKDAKKPGLNIPDTIVEHYENGFKQLRQEFLEHPTGREFANKHADLLDYVISSLFGRLIDENQLSVRVSTDDIAIIALGGYGRQELCPYSDIDIMILHRLDEKELVASLTERLFYPLWDLGLTLGHGTRTVKESIRMATENFELQTTFLDGRTIAGNSQLLEELQTSLKNKLKGKPRIKFLQDIFTENQKRYQIHGQAAFLLEPDIKEGEGGLRDIQAMGWAARGLIGVNDFDELIGLDYLSQFDVDSTYDSLEFLLTIRNCLHFIAGRNMNRLYFEQQLEISKTLGFKDTKEIAGIEQFMRDFYTKVSSLEMITRSFWAQMKERTRQRSRGNAKQQTAGSPGIIVENNKIALASDEAVRDYPGVEIGLFAKALELNLPIDYTKLDRIRDGILIANSDITWNEELRKDLIRILRYGERAIPYLETMNYLGILTRYIHDWSRITCLPQHDSYHLYTVDMHSFLTVAEAHKIALGIYDSSNQLAKQVYMDIEQKHLLLISCLLHDIGKGYGKGHAERGAQIAYEAAKRMGFPEKDCKQIEFLIENHLLLSDTAMRRDLSDENVILDVAENIMTLDRLRMLYVLSVADAMATGPKAWNTWKENLMSELFLKVLHVIKSGEYTSKKSISRMKTTTAAVKDTLSPSYSETEIETFLKQMPHSYLLAQESDDIVEHFKLIHQLPEDDISVIPRAKNGIYEVLLVAKDQPGLFYRVSGVLGLNGMNILGAQIYTRNDGTAFDIFMVENYFEGAITDEKWDKVAVDIRRALDGKIALDYRIADKAKLYDKATILKRKTKVEIDNSSSDFYTIIEVHTQDRVGLLYSITKVMFDLKLDIHLAKVSTNVDKVIDVFYVWDVYGQKLADTDYIKEVKRAIAGALEQ